MSIYRYLDEARYHAETCTDAADLRRLLRGLAEEYALLSAPRDGRDGYTLGTQRLTEIRNAAARASISKDEHFRALIIVTIEAFTAEAATVLGRCVRIIDLHDHRKRVAQRCNAENGFPMDAHPWSISAERAGAPAMARAPR